MTSGQKTALSLLISVLLFGAFALAAFAGLFSAIDARFYEPAKISGIKQRLESLSSSCDEYISALNERFALGESAFLKNAPAMSFVEAKPSESDVLARGELLGELRSSTPGLLGFRVLDKNQNSIHYSSFRSDILRRDEKNNLTAYKNYSECLSPAGNEEVSSQIVSCADSQGDLAAGKKIYFDGEKRALFSFPFYDKYSVFRGTAIFYVAASDFASYLLKKNLLSLGEGAVFYSNEKTGQDAFCGYAFGVPSVAQDEFKDALLDSWKNFSGAPSRLFAIDQKGENFWLAISQKSKTGIFMTAVCDDAIFSLGPQARFLILACVFLSIFLLCFLLLNVRRDDEMVIRERIKRLQLGVVDEYLSKKEALDWETISGRREAVTKEIIQSLGRRGRRRPAEVEALVNRSWDELLAAMNLRPQGREGGLENAQEIKAMLQEILAGTTLKVQAAAPAAEKVVAAPAPLPSAPRQKAPESPKLAVEEVEEAEEVLDAEPVEDLEEVEEAEEVLDAEPLEEAVKEEPKKAKRPSHEFFDISEDVGADFFAAKPADAEEKKPSSQNPLRFQRDKNYDPFFNAREDFAPNAETEELVHNFSAKGPDYSDLDARSEDQTLNGTFEEDKQDQVRELSLEDFGLKQDEVKEEFTEVLEFSAPKSQENDDGFDVAATFTTESPHFERDPFAFLSKKRSPEKAAPKDLAAASAIPVANPSFFSFSKFGQDSMVYDLPDADAKAIVQDSSGVFSISDELSTSGVVQDNSFKRLVESVLNNA